MQQTERALRAALAVLGLDVGAERGEIIRAYRQLAKANHPDVADQPGAPERFDTITAAYRRAMMATPSPRAVASTLPSRSPGTAVGAAPVLFPIVVGLPRSVILAGPVRIEPTSLRSPARTDERPTQSGS